MDLPLLSGVSSRVEWLERAGSTNDELTARAADGGWEHLSVVATLDQRSGRGRLGRTWSAPAGASLAISVLVRPPMPVESFGWLPLIAGAAMVAAVRSAGAAAALKWPNDVLIGDRKVCGILSELLPDRTGAVIGAGVNLAMREDQLPVPTATSLVIEGVHADIDRLAADFVARLDLEIGRLSDAAGDAVRSGVRDRVAALCGSIGRTVRVVMPDGDVVVGEGTGIDRDGRLLVERIGSPALSVAAGDVTHLRY